MASYIENSLIAGEQILHRGQVSKWSVSGLLAFGTLFLLMGLLLSVQQLGMGYAMLALGVVLLLSAWLKITSTELAITNKRVIAKFGFISRHTVELNLHKIESMQVQQGIVGRIGNFGSLVISGGGNPQAPIPGISNPLAFRKAFVEAQDQARIH